MKPSSLDGNQCLELIQREIDWCNQHKGESAQSVDFETGFVKGLQQAQFLIRKAEEVKRESLIATFAKYMNE